MTCLLDSLDRFVEILMRTYPVYSISKSHFREVLESGLKALAGGTLDRFHPPLGCPGPLGDFKTSHSFRTPRFFLLLNLI